ncbi:MAG: GDSL-type esterase/lipase family protein [Undibacterium sp.]
MNTFYTIGVIFFIILIGYGLFSYFRIQGLIAQSSLLVTHAQPFERTVSDAAAKALFIGDSTGVGVGATEPEESLAGLFAHDHPDWTVSNASVSGRKTAELIAPLQNLSKDSYELVVVQIGGNDITRFTPLDSLEKDIQMVIKEANRVASGQVILLTTGNVGNAPLLPRPLAFLWHWRTLAVRDIFLKAATETNISYVDLYQEPSIDPFALDPYRYHAADLFHPSTAGYALWYEDFKKALR